ncbi:hypothetical protein Q1695_004390 [Nippostrongylus brasiliensis]|nr:hypothetical protein Q1695_004390 [Nippostrongylus brasiliensis]
MVALQLLVVLVVLLTSDGAKSKGRQLKNACDIDALFCLHVDLADYNNEQAIVALHTSDEAKSKKEKPKTVCDYEDWSLFCLYMTSAHDYNEDAIYELEDQKVEPERFTEDIRRLRDTNSEIEKLLKLKVVNREHAISKVIRMVALQLLVVLVVLLTSDGAKSKGKQPENACDIDAKFCVFVSLADYNNERAIGDLMDETVEPDIFKESLKRLLDTNRDVKKLLKIDAENKSELVEASRIPLEMENIVNFAQLYRERIISTVNRMDALQLFVALVVLLTSNGAQSQGNTECAYQEGGNFCRHVRKAYEMNEEARKHLKDHRKDSTRLRHDGVLSSDNCDYEKWPSFCANVVQARDENEYAIYEVNDSIRERRMGFQGCKGKITAY